MEPEDVMKQLTQILGKGGVSLWGLGNTLDGASFLHGARKEIRLQGLGMGGAEGTNDP